MKEKSIKQNESLMLFGHVASKFNFQQEIYTFRNESSCPIAGNQKGAFSFCISCKFGND